jgi:hypothetical protein
MAKIVAKHTTNASVKLYDHATSLLQGVGSNIHHLHLVQVNDSMHPEWYFARWMMVLRIPSTG